MRALRFVKIIADCLHLNDDARIKLALFLDDRQDILPDVALDADRLIPGMRLYLRINLLPRHMQQLGKSRDDFRLDWCCQRKKRNDETRTVLHDALPVAVEKSPSGRHRRNEPRPIAVGTAGILVALIDLQIARTSNQERDNQYNQCAQKFQA